MRADRLLLLACAVAAIVPFCGERLPAVATEGFPGWPSQFEGRSLRALPLDAREQAFAKDFPGRIGRFSDGEREIVLRWVSSSTRRLHPASDCFRGIGYSLTPRPLIVDAEGKRWGSFLAARGKEQLEVRERIFDAHGQEWSDASAWYWAATTGKSQGPWWAVTVAAVRVSARAVSRGAARASYT